MYSHCKAQYLSIMQALLIHSKIESCFNNFFWVYLVEISLLAVVRPAIVWRVLYDGLHMCVFSRRIVTIVVFHAIADTSHVTNWGLVREKREGRTTCTLP